MAGTANLPSNVLTNLSPSQIQQQAVKTVAAEYKPVITSVQQQEQQAQGLADKRDADNQAYQSWLTSQTGALEAARTQQDTGLNTLLGHINDAQNGLYGGNMAQTLTDQANSRMGNVSNNGFSNVIGTGASSGAPSYTQSMEQSGRGLTLAATQLGAQNALTSNNLLGASEANDTAVINNNTKTNDAALQNTLTQLRNTLSTDQQKQAGATDAEYQNLYDKQVSLAENNRDYAASAYLDGLKAQNYASTITSRSQASRNSTANTNSEIAARAGNLANSTAKTGASLKNTADQIAVRNKTFNAKYGFGTTGHNGVLSPSEQNSAHAKIAQYAGLANTLLSSDAFVAGKNGAQERITPQVLHQLWQNGGQYWIKNNATGKYEMKTFASAPAGKNDPIWWSGFQTSNAGKGLTAWDVKALGSHGIKTLGLPVAPQKVK